MKKPPKPPATAAELRRKYDAERIVARYDLRYADFAGRRSDRGLWRALRRCLEPGEVMGQLVLDMPCGTGRLFTRLTSLGARIVGVDASRKMLAAVSPTRLASGEIQRLQADGLALPFAPGTFAAVFCVRFLHLFDTRARVTFLRALARASAGPLLAVYYPNHTIKQLGRNLRCRLLGRSPGRSQWIPWRIIRAEIAAAGLVCTRRARVCALLASGVVLRLEKKSPRP